MLLLVFVPSTTGPVFVAIAIALAAFGIGPLFALGTGLVVGSAPQERAGSAASLSQTSNEFGSTLGFAILGSIGAAVYRHQLTDSMPAGVPSGTAQSAKETVAEASAVAAQLPSATAQQLLDAAHRAFTNGMNVVATVAALMLVAVAVLTVTALRRAQSTADASTSEPIAAEPVAVSHAGSDG
jgi:DHA2 family multidrug resistance protein-like MFS transporter